MGGYEDLGGRCQLTGWNWVLPDGNCYASRGAENGRPPASGATIVCRPTGFHGANRGSPLLLPVCTFSDVNADQADAYADETATSETVLPACSDNIDNDGDGLLDFEDPGGIQDVSIWESPACVAWHEPRLPNRLANRAQD